MPNRVRLTQYRLLCLIQRGVLGRIQAGAVLKVLAQHKEEILRWHLHKHNHFKWANFLAVLM